MRSRDGAKTTAFINELFNSSISLKKMCRCIGKPTLCICETKGADQLCNNCTADQFSCAIIAQLISAFGFTLEIYNSSTFLIRNFKPLYIYDSCRSRFVSDLVGNTIVGFTMRRLRCVLDTMILAQHSLTIHIIIL